MPFLDGFILGLGMIVFIGPVLIQLITVSLQYGVKSGLSLAFGIFISDIACILICIYGNNQFSIAEDTQKSLSIAGAFLLFFLGAKTFITKQKLNTKNHDQSLKNYFKSFAKGFLVNFVNPFVFLVWIGVIVYAKSKYITPDKKIIYLSGVLLAILSMDVTKVFLAKRIGQILRSNSQIWIQRICGLILIGFSLRLLMISF
jgi:threonine/homoserine/homoserine lactone efflux protein